MRLEAREYMIMLKNIRNGEDLTLTNRRAPMNPPPITPIITGNTSSGLIKPFEKYIQVLTEAVIPIIKLLVVVATL